MKSHLEVKFLFQIKANKLPKPEQEFKFHDKRKWRFDFCWPDKRIAVEIEGGIWTHGAHNRGRHFLSDCEKYNAAALLGWKVLRFAVNQVDDGSAILFLSKAFEEKRVIEKGKGELKEEVRDESKKVK